MSSGTLDAVNYSPCEFLEDGTKHKRDLDCNQIERARGISNSRDGFESRNAERLSSSNGSVDALRLRRSVGGVGAGSHSQFALLQSWKNGASRYGAIYLNTTLEWKGGGCALDARKRVAAPETLLANGHAPRSDA
jgi:hypothetical protein